MSEGPKLARIERAGSEAADRIRWANQHKADVYAGRSVIYELGEGPAGR